MNSIVAEKSYISAKLGIPYENLSQSELRAETLLASSSSITFNLQKSKKAAPYATEKLLELNDSFVITHYTVKLKQVYSANATVDNATAANHGLATLYNYENEYVFSNGTGLNTGTNSANVKAIWNGQLTITIDRKVFIPAFPVLAFRRVPTSQQGAFLKATGGATATFGTNTGIDEVDNGLFGYYNSEPTLINGRQTINSQIDLPTAYTFSGDTVTSGGAAINNYAVLLCRGYLLVNSAD